MFLVLALLMCKLRGSLSIRYRLNVKVIFSLVTGFLFEPFSFCSLHSVCPAYEVSSNQNEPVRALKM